MRLAGRAECVAGCAPRSHLAVWGDLAHSAYGEVRVEEMGGGRGGEGEWESVGCGGRVRGGGSGGVVDAISGALMGCSYFHSSLTTCGNTSRPHHAAPPQPSTTTTTTTTTSFLPSYTCPDTVPSEPLPQAARWKIRHIARLCGRAKALTRDA